MSVEIGYNQDSRFLSTTIWVAFRVPDELLDKVAVANTTQVDIENTLKELGETLKEEFLQRLINKVEEHDL